MSYGDNKVVAKWWQLSMYKSGNSWKQVVLGLWGRYHQERSSQLITLENQMFPVKNLNLQSSSLVGLVANASVVKTR